MKKLRFSVFLFLTIANLILVACASVLPTPLPMPSPTPSNFSLPTPTLTFIPKSVSSPTPFDISLPTLNATPTIPLPTLTPTPWPLKIKLAEKGVFGKSSCKQLFQLRPGMSTLQEVYDLVGYPIGARDVPMGIALRYLSQHAKLPHVVVVDGVNGTVLFVSIVRFYDQGCPSLEKLKTRYGESVLATTAGNRNHWFFEGQNIADTEFVIQLLPPGTTLEQYQSHQGYDWESYYAVSP
jgi:hypothetical protein